ncbi:sigma-70 family RNA polymerase sigma factor [Bacillus haikouensis]|jgi:RNA polymerase sigma factor (sigma-70 family)|uniref:sigma-70 family RNA polymerase sigma factor n=1 Tax=Bacillus haikouensis TaxID=1510468 RepID=UPI00155662FD|nr:sigma-70 family RNA polymerase sigma factor [Bacillus haikouensis]NQD65034.1 sigma-70 family RNA polymerase sigma factor [Bacillus haikouensis]
MFRESVRKENEMGSQRLNELVEKLQHYCLFLTKNKWDGEDLCQESICRALKHYPEQEKWSSALLKKMAYHAWIDKIRKQSKEILGKVPEQCEEQQIEMDNAALEKLTNTLTPKQLVTLVLKEAFQYKISEIAAILNMTDTAVKAILKRTRARLERLSENDESRTNQEYWEENLQEDILTSLQASIQTQDPSQLIKQLPEWISTQSVPRMVSIPSITRSSSTPSSVLSMAA